MSEPNTPKTMVVAVTPELTKLLDDFSEWAHQRERVNQEEALGKAVPQDWYDSDDDAVRILTQLAPIVAEAYAIAGEHQEMDSSTQPGKD